MQLLVATTGDKAMLGSITSKAEHYAPWRDPYPLKPEDLAQRRGKPEQALTQQDILTEVIFHPQRLLDIVHNYVTFMQTDDGTSRPSRNACCCCPTASCGTSSRPN